jgi:hypothetical protein
MVGNDQILFGRICRVIVSSSVEKQIAKSKTTSTIETTTDALEIMGGVGGLRIQASIKKTLKKEPNTSEIRITNLAPSSRAFLQKKGVKVLFEAGYKDTGLSRLFYGDVRTVDHVKQGPDWETVMQLGDGERGWQYGRINESFSAGTSIASVVEKIALAMGLDDSKVANQLEDAASHSKNKVPKKLDHGFAVSGSASRAMDKIMKASRLSWSMQDGQLQILAEGQALEKTIPDITPSSGLISSPEMGTPPKKGKPALVKFDALFTPVKPGSKVKLKSDRYDGEVKILGVEFVLDTRGGPWYSRMAGEVLK